MEQLQSRLARIGSKRFLFIWSEKSFLSFKFFHQNNEKNTYLPNWFTTNIPHGFWKKYSLLQHLSLSGHLWLIFLVNISRTFSTVIDYNEVPKLLSSISTSLGESPKFPMSSTSIQSNSSSAMWFFLTQCLHAWQPCMIFENPKFAAVRFSERLLYTKLEKPKCADR